MHIFSSYGWERKKKERRAKVGNNNDQLRIAPPTRVAHARKPPGPKEKERLKVDNNNGQLGIATPPRVAHASHLGQKKKKRD